MISFRGPNKKRRRPKTDILVANRSENVCLKKAFFARYRADPATQRPNQPQKRTGPQAGMARGSLSVFGRLQGFEKKRPRVTVDRLRCFPDRSCVLRFEYTGGAGTYQNASGSMTKGSTQSLPSLTRRPARPDLVSQVDLNEKEASPRTVDRFQQGLGGSPGTVCGSQDDSRKGNRWYRSDCRRPASFRIANGQRVQAILRDLSH
jgi:hypothetical protein